MALTDLFMYLFVALSTRGECLSRGYADCPGDELALVSESAILGSITLGVIFAFSKVGRILIRLFSALYLSVIICLHSSKIWTSMNLIFAFVYRFQVFISQVISRRTSQNTQTLLVL